MDSGAKRIFAMLPLALPLCVLAAAGGLMAVLTIRIEGDVVLSVADWGSALSFPDFLPFKWLNRYASVRRILLPICSWTFLCEIVFAVRRHGTCGWIALASASVCLSAAAFLLGLVGLVVWASAGSMLFANAYGETMQFDPVMTAANLEQFSFFDQALFVISFLQFLVFSYSLFRLSGKMPGNPSNES